MNKKANLEKIMEEERKYEIIRDYLNDKVIEDFKREMSLKEKSDLIEMLVSYLKIADMKAELENL